MKKVKNNGLENPYEFYAKEIGFVSPKIGKTSKFGKNELVGLKFKDFDPAVVKAALGRPKAHKVNLFFYALSKDVGILINTKRNTLLLANSARVVRVFAKTVNN